MQLKYYIKYYVIFYFLEHLKPVAKALFFMPINKTSTSAASCFSDSSLSFSLRFWSTLAQTMLTICFESSAVSWHSKLDCFFSTGKVTDAGVVLEDGVEAALTTMGTVWPFGSTSRKIRVLSSADGNSFV